jgi:putative sigma-54 modulation protein
VNLILKGRGVELNDRLRDYASGKLSKTQRFFERIIKMNVELSEERNPRVKLKHRVEVTVKTPRETLRAHGAGSDYFAAIDQAAERLERQLTKFKGRLVGRRHPHGEPASNGRRPERPEVPDDRTVIVRSTTPELKPMTPEEAVIELEQQELPVLLFTSSETLAPGVVYRRGDGSFGLLEAAR